MNRVRRIVRSHLPLIVLLAIFLILAVSYSVAVPIFEGPDEDDHFRYVKFLADQRALPLQLFQPGGGPAGHQGWQPPLYYGLAALLIAPIDTSDFEQHLWRNPAASYQGDRACCGRNFYFHTDAEDWPYRGTTLAVHLARGLSIGFGLLTVASLYSLALSLFPGSKSLALVVSAIAALNPTFLFASALVSNDVPLTAFCTLTLLLAARLILGQRAPTLQNFLWLGVIISFALLVKTTALGLIPLALAVGAYTAWRVSSMRVFFNALLGMSVPLVLLTGWWFVRNQMLYGDPLAYRLVYASAIFPRESPLTWAELFQINLPWMWQTFWGGPTPGDFPSVLLMVLAVLTLAALVGAILFFVRHIRQILQSRLFTLALLAAWLVFIFVAQIQFIRTSGGTDQGRYLFPALASFAILFVLGLEEIAVRLVSVFGRVPASGLPQHSTSILISSAALALALYVLLANTVPAYAHPAHLTEQVLLQAERHVNVNFADQLALRGYSLSSRRLQRGETLDVTLFWQSRAPMRDSYRVFVHLVDPAGHVAGGKDVIPVRGAYATVLWKSGEWVQDTVSFPIAPDAVPSTYQVEVGLYPYGHPDARVRLAHSDEDHVLLDAVEVR